MIITEFVFNAPKCLVEAEKILDDIDKRGENYFDYLDNEEVMNAMRIFCKKPMMKEEE